jgi:hypothetical protein
MIGDKVFQYVLATMPKIRSMLIPHDRLPDIRSTLRDDKTTDTLSHRAGFALFFRDPLQLLSTHQEAPTDVYPKNIQPGISINSLS